MILGMQIMILNVQNLKNPYNYVEQGNKIQSLYGSWQKQGFVKVRAVGLWECPIRKLPLCNNTTTHTETLTEY